MAWSGSGPGGALGKNFPGKVSQSHPQTRSGQPRSRNTNMLCDESHGDGGVCMLRRTVAADQCVCVSRILILGPIFDGKRKVGFLKMVT